MTASNSQAGYDFWEKNMAAKKTRLFHPAKIKLVYRDKRFVNFFGNGLCWYLSILPYLIPEH